MKKSDSVHTMDLLASQGNTIMFSDPILATINIVLLCGIVLALIAAPMIKKGNKELHAKNMAARRKMSRVYHHSES